MKDEYWVLLILFIACLIGAIVVLGVSFDRAKAYIEEADNTIAELNEANQGLNEEIESLKAAEEPYYKEYSYSYESKDYSYEYQYKETIPRKGIASWISQ